MPGEEQIATARRWWGHLEREPMTPERARDRTLDPFVEQMHDPQVVVDVTAFAGWPDRPVYRGHDGLRRVLEVWSWFAPTLEFEVEMMDAVGDRVVTAAVQRAHRTQRAVPIETRFSTVMTVREGRIERISVYSELEEALRSAGLSV
jgi:ketosteroid isomerase-like protein